MANRDNKIELVFDCLFHGLTADVPKLIPEAKEEYRKLERALTTADKRKLNFVSSLLEYCEQERWGLANTQLPAAEHEYSRFFLDGVAKTRASPQEMPPRPLQLTEYPDNALSNNSRDSHRDTASQIITHRHQKSNENSSYQAATSIEGVLTPEQIADKFRQIYNNEWKSAVTELGQLRIYQTQAIGCLLTIVMDAYRVCKLEAENQIAKLESAAVNIMMEGTYVDKSLTLGGNRRYLVHYRKEISDVCIERLQESFRRRYLPEIIRKVGIYQNVRTHGPVIMYANKCIAVCWKMVVLDPPVHMLDERYVPGVFKHDMYEHYTNGGDSVAYFVWPALLKYKDGPILSRGIAQGK